MEAYLESMNEMRSYENEYKQEHSFDMVFESVKKYQEDTKKHYEPLSEKWSLADEIDGEVCTETPF